MRVKNQAARASGYHYADAGLALLLMLIVGMMIVPLPTWVLDLLIASNLTLAVMMLVTAMYVPHGLAFTSMPTMLLVTTLYRLALNVSSTRLILLQADAGHVIRAFGNFVVRGNYVVGGVVFLILTIIQYLVVAKGGERVAEVGARFTLDALPGKQMAVDADLRAGALNVEAARARRALLERESQFYGAMDGAMKFVKGDAVAGIAIAVISLLGGTAIGMGMRGLSLTQSLQTYGLLTIGDGLVSQIPSLVISTAAGLVVTRVAVHAQQGSLAQDISDQVLGDFRVLAAAASFVLLLALVPGLPALPFLTLAAMLGTGSRLRFVQGRNGRAASERAEAAASSSISIQLGAALAERVQAQSGEAELQRALAGLSLRLHATLGVQVGGAIVEKNPALDADGYSVLVHQSSVLRGKSSATGSAFAAAIALDLAALLPLRARDLLSLEDVQRRLDELEERAPALVHSVVPKSVSLPVLTDVLRRLLDEGVSVRAFSRILEALALPRKSQEEPALLVERVRLALREEITARYEVDGVLAVHRLEPMLEDAVRDAIQTGGGERYLALPPSLASDIVAAVRRTSAASANLLVLVTQPDLRRFLREVLASELPEVAVLSYGELPPALSIEEREPITIG